MKMTAKERKKKEGEKKIIEKLTEPEILRNKNEENRLKDISRDRNDWENEYYMITDFNSAQSSKHLSNKIFKMAFIATSNSQISYLNLRVSFSVIVLLLVCHMHFENEV